MRRFSVLLLGLAACSPNENKAAPEMDLAHVPEPSVGGLSSEGDIAMYLTHPGVVSDPNTETDLDDALVALIDATTTTLDLALYEFDNANVIAAVEDAWDRGVDIRFVGDGDEIGDDGYVALDLAGVPMTNRPAGSAIMHNKFIIADDQVVWTGSTNVSENGVHRNNNHSLIIRSRVMATSYTEEFEQMAAASFGRGKDPTVAPRSASFATHDLEWHFSPENNPVDVLVDLIDAADVSVHFMVFSFTHTDVVDALLRAQARGVTVVGVFDESQANGAWSVDETLALAGVPVYIDGNENASGWSGGKLHHKVLVVDAGRSDAVAVSGSMNWSAAGTGNNDENLIVVNDVDVVNGLADEFCAVFAVASFHPDNTAQQPDICTGEALPPDILLNEVNPGRSPGRAAYPFIELVNATAEKQEMDGWTLEMDGSVVHSFTGSIPGGEALVVVPSSLARVSAGVVASEGAFVVPYAFGEVLLRAANGAVVDRFDWVGSPRASWNRAVDGDSASAWVAHTDVPDAMGPRSPGSRACGVPWDEPLPAPTLVINEVLPDPAGTDLGQEYVEIVNAGPLTVNLDRWTLCDASGVCHRFEAADLSPGDAVVLFDRGDHSGVPNVVLSSQERLSLNNDTDTLTLTDPDGAVHDTVTWTSSSSGMSWNRVVDGEPGAAWLRHDLVEGANRSLSPGTRVDGSAW